MMPKSSEHAERSVIVEAVDGKIRVSFGADGLIESLHLDPRVKRLTVDDLADNLMRMITSAQEECLRRAAIVGESRRTADERLRVQVMHIHDEGARRVARCRQFGAEVIKRMEEIDNG